MDKRTIIIIIGLGVLVIFWIPIMTTLGLIEPSKPPVPSEISRDSLFTQPEETQKPDIYTDRPAEMAVDDKPMQETEVSVTDTLPQVLEDSIVIETNVQRIALSNYGGAPVSIQLKKYHYNDNGPIEMLPDCKISTPEIKSNRGTVNGNDFIYTPSGYQQNYSITSGTAEITYTYNGANGGSIRKRYIFYADKYDYDLFIEITNPSAMGFDRKYSLEWNNKLLPTELNIQDDYNSMWAMAKMADVRVKFDDYDNDKFGEIHDGRTDWVAIRSKYFAAILIPKSSPGVGALSTGVKTDIKVMGEDYETRELTAGIFMESSYSSQMADSFTVYVGPLDYDILKGLKGEVVDLLDIGTTPYIGWIIKIFATPILWILPKIYSVVPNYGVVIIIFSLLVKVITWPLSRKSVQSMAAMRDLQPKMKALQEKHKKNPQALNKEMMKLYKEHGVNPLSGCLPMIPQMPLFFALFAVFRSTILLRQAPFILWWDDLSRGAMSLTDPYMILVILMVGLMFVQQKVTMTDPKNKALTYMFPLMLGVFFYKASAGLILYWTMFSLFSFLEQVLFKKSKASAKVETA